jgi:hypothetical protein
MTCCCAPCHILRGFPQCSGNPLGIVYVPCQAAADGLNIMRTPSSMTPSTSRTQPAQNASAVHLPGANSWLPGVEQRRRHTATTEVYNFFSERVRSAPEFTFPPPSPSETVSLRTTQSSSPAASATPASQGSSVTSTSANFSSRQWIYGLSMRSIDTIQAFNSHGDNQTEEAMHSVGSTLPEDGTEGDSAEKPEDTGPGGGGQIHWAER